MVDYLPAPRRTSRPSRAPTPRPVPTTSVLPILKAPFSSARVQDHDRPLRGQAHLPARLLGLSWSPARTCTTPAKDKKERVSAACLQMHSNQRVSTSIGCAAGDIVAVVGLKDTTTGDTLCAEDAPIILESMQFADPVIDIAVEPKTKAEQDKMGVALQKLAEEDPTFRVSTNHETGQTIIAGMGELHLEIIIDRLLREFKVEANVGKPQVAYRERPGHEVLNAEGKFVRQTGGRGQYGHAVINMYPQEPGAGYLNSRTRSSAAWFPRNTSRPVDKGIQEALNSGVLAGLSGGGRARGAHRRLVPRRGLVRGRVQGGWLHGHQGRAQEVRPGHPRAGHGRGESRRRKSTPASSWATSPAAAASSRARSSAAAPVSHPPRRCRWARCSATPPTLRSWHAGPCNVYTMQFDSYEPCRRPWQTRLSARRRQRVSAATDKLQWR